MLRCGFQPLGGKLANISHAIKTGYDAANAL